MEYTLIRSNRKTLAIQIKQDGQIVVRSPKRVTKKEIDCFVAQKEGWILNCQEKLKTQMEEMPIFCVRNGVLPLLGEMKPIQYTQYKKGFYDQSQGIFYLQKGSEEQLKSQAEELYRQIAKQEIINRVNFYAPQLGVIPTAIHINGARGRWGSCSGKNSLNFSWRLMTAPQHCVDYVVVHELCHILQHNHSREFWKEVERVFPNWQQCRKELNQTAQALRFW